MKKADLAFEALPASTDAFNRAARSDPGCAAISLDILKTLTGGSIPSAGTTHPLSCRLLRVYCYSEIRSAIEP
ncbi:hypothetical protein [Paenibacillus massiliensis]|uniref:hypothetical protein n=1 Tax=Paenibacillus massiliensis TaxID=225917 RepID=UPI0003A0C293|nr:hypothetical protein [Paenibacillus massiliensis]